MTFVKYMLSNERPESLRDIILPRDADGYYPSPADWRDEVLYFLLPDRFSDGNEHNRPLLRQHPSEVRPHNWNWQDWFNSGSGCWQGGKINGIRTKLDYLNDLGITAIWIGPIFKQRNLSGTYHGYGIQDFLDVDPRFGTREDLVWLVYEAHKKGIRIILDIIFNHSGANWDYLIDGNIVSEPDYLDSPYKYKDIAWRNNWEQPIDGISGKGDGVWPRELQDKDCYTRAGKGDLGAGEIEETTAQHKRTDFFSFRDFDTTNNQVLTFLAECYKYWIALTDCDGFRIDTLKHVSLEEARDFCGSIKEYAVKLGKHDFFLVGEVAGGDYNANRYLDVLTHNLNAALDIGEMRSVLCDVARGLTDPQAYFNGFSWNDVMGSHRKIGNRHVSILNDHDHVWGEKLRFSSHASSLHQVIVGVALQLFTLGIPCIYYGTEQALSGPEESERVWIPYWGNSDVYLREAMFGPEHPLDEGDNGNLKNDLPGFGPYGTSGYHCFDQEHPVFKRIASLNEIRKIYPSLRYGRQYLRPFSILDSPFEYHGAGEIIPWARVLDDEETLCIVNSSGSETRGGDVMVDAGLSNYKMTVVANTEQAADPQNYRGVYPVGAQVDVCWKDGVAYVPIRDLPPSEVIVLTNYPR